MRELGTITEFAKAQGFGIMSKVRENTNGYKFVTLVKLDAEGNAQPDGAENVYLSIALGEESSTGDKLASDLPVKEVENEAGDKRIKICSAGGEYDAI